MRKKILFIDSNGYNGIIAGSIMNHYYGEDSWDLVLVRAGSWQRFNVLFSKIIGEVRLAMPDSENNIILFEDVELKNYADTIFFGSNAKKAFSRHFEVPEKKLPVNPPFNFLPSDKKSTKLAKLRANRNYFFKLFAIQPKTVRTQAAVQLR